MTSQFIRCSIDEVMYDKKPVINNPINLARVDYFECGKFSQYPDSVGLPTIRFCLLIDHQRWYQWVYPTVELRDRDYGSLLARYCETVTWPKK